LLHPDLGFVRLLNPLRQFALASVELVLNEERVLINRLLAPLARLLFKLLRHTSHEVLR